MLMYTTDNMVSFSGIINGFFFKYRYYVWTAIMVMVFLVGSIFAYQSFYLPYIENRESKDISNRSDGIAGQVVPIYFIHVDWCHFCTDALPEWKRFSDNMNGKRINGYVLECIDIDMSDAKSKTKINEALRQKYNVESFPTVQMTFKGKTVTMDANPTEKTLNDFVNTMIV